MPRRKSDPRDFDARHGQWLKGVLDLCVIGLMGDTSTYGYELASRFEEAGLGTIKGGTLYPRLSAMEDAGLLVAEWRPGDGGPGRKYYRVSDAGKVLLAEGSTEWGRFAAAIGVVLGGDGAGIPDGQNELNEPNDKESVQL